MLSVWRRAVCGLIDSRCAMSLALDEAVTSGRTTEVVFDERCLADAASAAAHGAHHVNDDGDQNDRDDPALPGDGSPTEAASTRREPT